MKKILFILIAISLVVCFIYVNRQPELDSVEKWNKVTQTGFENPILAFSNGAGPTNVLSIGQATRAAFDADVVSDDLEALKFFAVPNSLFQVVVLDEDKSTVLWNASPTEIDISGKRVSFDLPIRLRSSTPVGKCSIQIQFYHRAVIEQEIEIRE